METSQPVVAVVPVPEVQSESSIPTSSRYPDIFEAAKNGLVDDIRYFLANGVDVNSKSEPRSWTEVRTINGRDINVRFSSPSATPLQNAINNPRHGLEIVKYLISQGAEVNVRDHADTTPLHFAAANHFPNALEVVKMLVAAGADINAESRSLGTPLHFAANMNTFNADAFRYLASVADVNARSNITINRTKENPNPPTISSKGNTPLDAANTDAKREILRAAGGKLASELDSN
jgi:ankyrin repeat protein